MLVKQKAKVPAVAACLLTGHPLLQFLELLLGVRGGGPERQERD